MPRLENWSIVYDTYNMFSAPELLRKRLQGNIYNDENERFPDGSRILTSNIETLDLESKIATTENTTYILGKIEPEYEKFIKESKEV